MVCIPCHKASERSNWEKASIHFHVLLMFLFFYRSFDSHIDRFSWYYLCEVKLVITVEEMLQNTSLLSNDQALVIGCDLKQIVENIGNSWIVSILDHYPTSEIDDLQFYLIISLLNISIYKSSKCLFWKAWESLNEFIQKEYHGGFSPPRCDFVERFDTK